jgi:signal transduction histidine kinase/CheY-like chemotaxis protein
MAVADYPVSRALLSRQAVESEVIGVAVPGKTELAWLDVSAFPECSPDGRLEQVVVSFQDATQRVQAEQARNRVTRALRLLSDTNMAIARDDTSLALLQDACRLICERGGYLVALVAFADDAAPARLQVLAQSGLAVLDLDAMQLSWRGAATRTQIHRDLEAHPDQVGLHALGATFGIRSSIAIPFAKKSGKRGVLMLYAAQANAFNAEEVELLEELVTNLTHGLDALQAQKRRIEAESASRSKANFLANMSHEIRTPLNAITGMAHLIRRDGITPSQAAKLDKLETANQHLLGIITNILDLSKIDADKLELEVRPLRIERVVSNVLAMVKEAAAGKCIALFSETLNLPANLAGDFTRLQQALANYATNAIKFTESGQVGIRVSVLEDSEQSALLRFAVTDTGVGVDPLMLERLFTAFEQADNSTTRKYGGTGLGLAIARKLAQLMSGHAGAESQLGVGSTFWFTARLHKHAVDASGAADLPDAPRSGADTMEFLRSNHAGLAVLVAEDEPVNCELARILLEDIGFVVDVAEDGQEALERASQFPYQLILMDMQMPRLNGLDATRAIRKLAAHGRTPIIGCTANAFQEDRTRCIVAGMTCFVTKPTLPDVLYAAIALALAPAPGA